MAPVCKLSGDKLEHQTEITDYYQVQRLLLQPVKKSRYGEHS